MTPLDQLLTYCPPDNTLCFLEITVGFENNMENSSRKAAKCKPLLRDLDSSNRNINFINLLMSALGNFESSSYSVVTMIDDSGFVKINCNQIIKKIINVLVRCTHSIYCSRNNSWTNPELLERYNFIIINFLLQPHLRFFFLILCLC